MCILCLTEKLWIINVIHNNNYLNKQSELINKCRHINKFFIKECQEMKLIADLHSLMV